jgi:hypothetical protein
MDYMYDSDISVNTYRSVVMKSIYLIGSLRNPDIPKTAAAIRAGTRLEVFDDWYAAGPIADDSWRDYEQGKGHNFPQALAGYAARHVFSFDQHHLNRCDSAVLCLPAGKSGHLELGYMAGLGKPTFILMEGEPERFDVMYQFATGGVYYSVESLCEEINSVVSVRAFHDAYDPPDDILTNERYA